MNLLKSGRHYLRLFVIHYLTNHIINKIPSYSFRNFFYSRILKIEIGNGSSIHLGTIILEGKTSIGTNSTINRNCLIDSRGSIIIGNNVSISPDVHLITADHVVHSTSFEFRSKPIKIEDYVFIGSRSTILPGVHIGRGAVVCAGSVVTKSVLEYSIVGGVPAKPISQRNTNLDYSCSWFMPFD